MGLIDGLKKAVETVGEQITSSSPKPKEMYFTANFQKRAKQWGLTEADATDGSQQSFFPATAAPLQRSCICLFA